MHLFLLELSVHKNLEGAILISQLIIQARDDFPDHTSFTADKHKLCALKNTFMYTIISCMNTLLI